MNHRPRPWAALILIAGLPACSGTPPGLPVPEEPDEVTVADFLAGPLVEPSAFSWVLLQKVRTDQTSEWDFAFALQDDVAQLVPRGAALDEPSSAGLQHVDESFDELVLAPEDGYVTDEPLTVRVGDVLAGVSRRNCGGVSLRRFGKLEILDIDLASRRLTFKQLANPNCENRNLVPGEVGEV